jgi:hypothetical protein
MSETVSKLIGTIAAPNAVQNYNKNSSNFNLPQFRFSSHKSHSFVFRSVILVRRFLERISSIVSCQLPRQSNQHFPQWRMNVEEECSVDIPTAHLPEVSFIPTTREFWDNRFERHLVVLPNMIWFYDFVEACRYRNNDDNCKSCWIPFVGIARILLDRSFNWWFFSFGRRHLLVLALMSFEGKRRVASPMMSRCESRDSTCRLTRVIQIHLRIFWIDDK